MKIRLFGHYVSPSMVFLIAAEFCLLIGVFYSGYLLRWSQLGGGWILANLREAIAFATVFVATMGSLGLYQRGSSRNLRETFIRLLTSCVIGFVGLIVVVYAFKSLEIWRSTLAFVMPLTFAVIMTSRYLFAKLFALEKLKQRVMVIGAGKLALRISRLAEQDSTSGFTVTRFFALGDRPPEIDSSKLSQDVNRLAQSASELGVEEIVVAVEDRRGQLPMDQLLACRAADIRVTEYSTFWERETGQVDLDAFNPSFMLYAERFVGGRFQATMKRAFDISASLLLLVLASPVIVLTAILVRMTSAGPILYRQERTGRGGVPFTLFKFRSMRVDAEGDGQPRWASEQDPRVTAVGAFIRKTRIDEIPQVFNVLRGEMSFIGPRPERPFFVEQLMKEIRFYGERHWVKPGISGWAQLKYPYGASLEDARGKLQYDLYYVKNYSLFLDALILLQTVRVVLFRIGSR